MSDNGISGPALLVRLARFKKRCKAVPDPTLAHLRQCDREVIERFQDALRRELKEYRDTRKAERKVKLLKGHIWRT